MFLSNLFERAAPHRFAFLIAFSSGMVLGLALFSPFFPVEIVQNAPLPDLAHFGYSPEETRAWYEAIGETGRSRYAYVAYPIDVAIIIPAYTLLMSSQLYVWTKNESDSSYWRHVSYLPIIAALSDLVETSIHSFAVGVDYPNNVPSDPVLELASLSTQGKYVCFNVAVLLCFGSLFFPRKSKSS
eukprot:CAMPEP_0197449020 /NCGR_PEP_ID=MMETSP1175-20131217/19922_1 /TAXON_ID=1003142 /ORGANISM="Triceratium dubium, Strain CCMP147" /LENGTH=184 /DNA_ID=CAMNT_0042981001 /DNA_START=58 /DNA_END=612 /DNA_ORIENTATION=+